MAESLRVLWLLFHKNLLIRKSLWKMSLFGEVLIPVGLILCLCLVRDFVAQAPIDIKNSTYYEKRTLGNLTRNTFPSANLYYAPNNSFTKKLIEEVGACAPLVKQDPNSGTNISFYGYATEEEAIFNYVPHEYDYSFTGIALFDPNINEETKHLKYKIPSTNLYKLQLYSILGSKSLYDYYTNVNNFLSMQICIDQSFIKLKANDTSFKPLQMFVQQVPYPPFIKHDISDSIFRQFMGSLIVIAFMIPLFIETSKASSEKFLGVNILMSMNGVSNTMNLFSWLISGLSFITAFVVVPITINLVVYPQNALPFVYYGSTIVTFLMLVFHIGHLLAFGIHVSGYFSRSLYVIFGLLVIDIGGMVVQLYGLNEHTYYIAPYLGILFPQLLLVRAFDELNYYESIGEGVRWDNLFEVGNSEYGTTGSTGMILILSIIGMILHFLMAIYLYAINPGKYGVRKHPLFFLQSEKERTDSDNMQNVEYNGLDREPFESAPKDVFTPGIQIRNLKKEYNSVHALRGVSIDYYKGQITSLLGHNGAGKTTMMSILTGMMSQTSGTVLINSLDIRNHRSEIMNNMGLCTQENMVFPSLTVIEQLKFFAMLKGKDKTKATIEHNVNDFLKKLKLYEKRNVLPSDLSGGQKRRLCLGMALVGDPSILILDEPTSGLDPESRRVIWDMLLKMRGQKTILISTHDMEEADILGDRIAILHTGLLRSYGTSMFLKKLLGQDTVEVTLSVEPGVDPELIRYELDCDAKIVNVDGSKIVMTIPNSSDLPDSLDKLERKKQELGILGLSVSLISLEQVFLKVTQEHDDTAKVRQPFKGVDRKVTGNALYWQSVRALLLKKITYTRKNLSTLGIQLLLTFVALLSISLILKESSVRQPTKEVTDMKLNKYSNPETYYKSYDKNLGEKYKQITKDFGGNAMESNDPSLSDSLINYAKKNLAFYDNHMIAAAEFNKSDDEVVVNALFSNKASYSLPISVNLLTNTILKTWVGDDYEISVSSEYIVSHYDLIYSDNTMVNALTTAVIFVFLSFPILALYVLHPHRESSTGVKQLQRMTGVSGYTYWGHMFLFDFAIFLVITILIVAGFVTMDNILDFRIYGLDEILISLLLIILFAINTLPLIYAFSLLKSATSAVVRILIYVPIGFVTVELLMYAVYMALSSYQFVRIFRPIQKGIFLLVPYVSFFHSQIAFFLTAQKNARCKKMPSTFYETTCATPYGNDICCRLQCKGGVCKYSLKYFTDFEEDITLEESLIYLCLTPILYCVILAILENQVIQTIMARRKAFEVPEYEVEEKVMEEKNSIAQKIATLNGENITIQVNGRTENGVNSYEVLKTNYNKSKDPVFLVYELRKQYGKLMAVKDVSFGVNQHECFGLLGVNGAGKSTTFRMMTGAEVPNNGTMYIGEKNITKDRKYFLSQMGYCPQNDALIRCLNSYDHLRLFARLRGIPEDQVETEVQTWILRLNLTACASQVSGTYSGGNKRRLNIAIALIGIPNLVLMDEPTTGVDPGARRSLWNVIQACQTMGQAVVLTSHSMEECEVLCKRLAIMVDGRLVCIGPSEELKERFGAGYDIQIKLNPEKTKDQVDGIKADMVTLLHCELIDEHLGYLMYHVTPNETTWRKMDTVMSTMKSKYDSIDDYSILSSTLEQLFLLFARATNKDQPKQKAE